MNASCRTMNKTQDAEWNASRLPEQSGSVMNMERRRDSYIIPPVPRTETYNKIYEFNRTETDNNIIIFLLNYFLSNKCFLELPKKLGRLLPVSKVT